MPLLGGVQQLSSGSLGLSEPMPLPVGRLARPDLWAPGGILLLGLAVAVPAALLPLVHVVVLSTLSAGQCGDPAATAGWPGLDPLWPSTGVCPGRLSPRPSSRGLRWRPLKPLSSHLLFSARPQCDWHVPRNHLVGFPRRCAACISLMPTPVASPPASELPRWAPRPFPEALDHAPWGSSRQDLVLMHRSLVSPGVASPASSRAGSCSSPAALPVVFLDRLPRTQESHNSLDW
jgi:hypothetical protein